MTNAPASPGLPPPGPGTLDLQLLLVRSLIDRARTSVRDSTGVGSMTAMLLADVAVETVVKMACRHLSVVPPGNTDKIHEYLRALERAKPALAGVPEMTAVAQQRKSRNLVQHEGTVLDAAAVSASTNDAEAFCALVTREVWQRDFGAVSVVALVQQPQLRQILDAAVVHRQAGGLRSALILATAGFDYLHYSWARAVRLADGYDESHDGFLAGWESPFLKEIGVNLTMPKPEEPEESGYPTLARMTLGMSAAELVRVRLLKASAERALQPRTRPIIQAADVDFLIEVVARTAWRLEVSHPGALAIAPPVPRRARKRRR